MNQCFLIGDIIETSPFKFILHDENTEKNPAKRNKFKSMIEMKIKIVNRKQILDVVAYDDTADYILRNKIHEDERVFVYGYLKQRKIRGRKRVEVVVLSIKKLS